jgi:exonuclease III
VRQKRLELHNLEIIGLAETLLRNDNSIHLDHYKVFGHNWKRIHKRAKKGSGGVGFLVREELLSMYDVYRVDDSHEGILWLRFKSKKGGSEFLCCVCYLPVSESTLNIDGEQFSDALMCQIHVYCKGCRFFLCGDYNARCSDLDDFIAGVDEVTEREVIDFTPEQT